MVAPTDVFSLPDGIFDFANAMDNSPVSYLDSIMNGKLLLSYVPAIISSCCPCSPNVRLYSGKRVSMIRMQHGMIQTLQNIADLYNTATLLYAL